VNELHNHSHCRTLADGQDLGQMEREPCRWDAGGHTYISYIIPRASWS
jgi:hypothetical protein